MQKKFFHTEKLIKLLDDHRAGKADNSRRMDRIHLPDLVQFFPRSRVKSARSDSISARIPM